ncbi:MAG TPA: N-acetylmuramoyl-L-alanine amidase [Mycobacterium sp.]
MAWYPGAVKMELQPESDAQPAIRPTQFIVHSIAAPWDEQRLYEYWKSSSLESHFGLDYDGSLGQYIGTETRADANAGANRRPDGTGAISCETASNTSASDPWTAQQIEKLIRLGVWAHQRHEIPLRICRSWADPGYGYHSLFPQWSTSGTACPGNARIEQFKKVVFPGIVARATGKTTPPQEADVTPAQIQDAVLAALKSKAGKDAVYDAVLRNDRMPAPLTSSTRDTNPTWMLASIHTDTNNLVRATKAAVDAHKPVELTDTQLAALGVAVTSGLADAVALRVADLLAERLAE